MNPTRCLLLVLLFLLGIFSAMNVEAQDARHQALLAAVKANPKDPFAHFNLGVSYFNQQIYDEAAVEFRACLQLDPGDHQAKALLEGSLGIDAYLKRDFRKAVEHLERAAKLKPDDSNFNMLLGDSYTQLGQYEKAEQTLRRFSENSSGDKTAQAKGNEGLGKIYLGQKKFAEAAAAFEKVAASDPRNLPALQNLGYAYFQLKDFKAASKAWERAAKIRKDSQTLKFLGFAYYNLGDFKKAIDNYKKSIRIESSKDEKAQDLDSLAETHYNLAVAYNDNAMYDEAVGAFGAAFKINPKDSNAALGQAQAIDLATTAHMEKASNHLLSNRYTEAISEWKKVLDYQPDNAQAKGFIEDAKSKAADDVDKLYASGKANAAAGKNLAALSDWKQALKMDPDNDKVKKAIKGLEVRKTDQAKALLAEGDALSEAGDITGALEAYKQAAKINPKSTLAKTKAKNLGKKRTSATSISYTKGMTAYKKGDLKTALRELLSSKEINPNDSRVQDALFKVQKDITVKAKALNEDGVNLFNSGNKEEAKRKFEQVLKLKPTDETANDYVKRMTGQQSVQKADAEKVKALYYEGVNLYINGKIHEAIAKWEQCLDQDQGNINAQNNIKKAKIKLQSIEKLSKN